MNSTADVDTLTELLEDDIFKLPYRHVAEKLVYSVQTSARVSGHSSDSLLPGYYIPPLKPLPFHESLQLCDQLCTSVEVLCQWVSLREKYERLWTSEWEKSASSCVKKVEGRSVTDQGLVAKVQEKCQAPTKQVGNSVKEVMQADLQEKCRAPIKDRESVAQEKIRASLPKKTEEKILVRAQTLVARNRQATLQTKDVNVQKKILGRAQKVYAKYAASFPKQTSEPEKQRDRHDHVREASREVVAVLRYLRQVAEEDELRLLETEQELISKFKDIYLGAVPNKAASRPVNALSSVTSPHDILAQVPQENCHVPEYEDSRVINRKRPAPHEKQICVEIPKKKRRGWRKGARSANESQGDSRTTFPRNDDSREVNRKRPAPHEQHSVDIPKKICRVPFPRNEESRLPRVSHEMCQVPLPRKPDNRVIHSKRPIAHEKQFCVETPKKKFQFAKIVWDL